MRTGAQKANLGKLEEAVQIEKFEKYLDIRTKCRWEVEESAILHATARMRP